MSPQGLGRAGRFLAVGFEFAAVVVAGIYIGSSADAFLGTSPLLLVVFAVGAMAGAVVRLLWVLRRLER